MKRINIATLSLRNLQRKFIRTVLLLLAVAMVTGTLFGATIFMTGMQNALRIGTYRLGADILVVPEEYEAQARAALLAGEPTSFYMDKEVFDKVLAVEGVKRATPQLFIKPTSFTCCYNVDVFLVAFDPETDFTISPWLQGKRTQPLGLDEAIVGDALPIMNGSLIPFFGTAFTVIGTMEPTGMKFFDQSLFMTMESAYQMAEQSKTRATVPLNLDRDKISAVLVQADESISPDRLAIRLAYAIPGIKAIASDEVVNTVRRQLGGLMHGILVICSVLWILALVMIGFAFYMIVNERQREFGLLRGMGAKRKQVLQLILQEAFFISLAGGIIGLAIGSALLIGFQEVMINSLKLPYLLPPSSILYQLVGGALVFSVLTGLISAIIPAVIASRLDPYEAIRQGE